MDLLELLRQFAAQNTDPAGSVERIAALRAFLETHRTESDEPIDLAALDSAAMAAFEEIAGGAMTPQALSDMQALADICDATRELDAADQAAANELAAQAAELRNRVAGTDPAEGDQDTGEGGTDGGTDPGTEGGTDSGEQGEQGGEQPAETAPEQTPALVASGRRRPSVPLGGLPNHRRAARSGSGYQWRAAAEIRGIAAGSDLRTADDVVQAAITRMQSFSRSGLAGVHQGGIAVIDRSGRNGAEFTIDGTDVSVEMVERLTDESRLDGGSLIAAGGWCAPSETLYDLLPGADANAGIWNVPTMTARRGGVRWPATPQFSAIYGQATASFYQTEATVMAGATPKPCYEIPCTTFNEERLGVAGICLRSPILTERGYPELVRSVTAEALAAHAHKVNQRKIADAVTDATANTMTAAEVDTAGLSGYSATLLTMIELQVEYLRYRHRWAPGTTVEAVLPLWARGTMRADLAGRNGQPFENVTDAMVDAHLRSRGVNPQWVYDWQDSFATGVAGDFGGTSLPKRFPANVSILLYRAGTYFVAESDVITVDGLYDSTLLSQNMHLAYFTEEGFAVGKRDWPGIVLTIPVVPAGYTGAQIDPVHRYIAAPA